MLRFTRMIAVCALLAGALTATAGHAASTCPYSADLVAPPAHDPRLSTHSLTINGGEYRFAILVPPGYGAPGNERRYPVLYLMGGGFFNQNSWFSHEGIAKAMDVIAFTAHQPVSRQAILVSPDDRDLGAYADWTDGTQLWETFHVHRLVPWIDAHYRTIPDRGHRALIGISGGGLAVAYAARYPELYGTAAALSGALSPTWFHAFDTAASPAAFADSQACPGPNGRARDPYALWGNPATQDLRAHEHDPSDLAPNLGATAISLRVGNGIPCKPKRDLRQAWNPLWHVERVALGMTRKFDTALTEAGVAHDVTYTSCGVHSFPYWATGFHVFWDFFWKNMGRGAPTMFSYRSAARAFNVWGWTVKADPSRADEFLDMTKASCRGVALTGSGRTRVTTKPCFAPGQSILLAGAVEHSVVADAEGRISFFVDLGPAHTLQQFTIPETVVAALGNYFTTRTVRFN